MIAITNTPNEQSKSAAMPKFSLPRMMLHIEGLAIFMTAVVLYSQQSGEWLAFIALLLVPDVGMAGYLVNKRVGAMIYNVVHTYTTSLIVLGIGFAITQPLIVSLGLILLAHQAMDRIFGYGLKYETAFKDTHMARV